MKVNLREITSENRAAVEALTVTAAQAEYATGFAEPPHVRKPENGVLEAYCRSRTNGGLSEGSFLPAGPACL